MEKIEGEYANKISTQTRMNDTESGNRNGSNSGSGAGSSGYGTGANETEDPGEIPCHPQ